MCHINLPRIAVRLLLVIIRASILEVFMTKKEHMVPHANDIGKILGVSVV